MPRHPRLLRIWIHFSGHFVTRSAEIGLSPTVQVHLPIYLESRHFCGMVPNVPRRGLGLRYFSGEKFSEPWLAAVPAPPFKSFLPVNNIFNTWWYRKYYVRKTTFILNRIPLSLMNALFILQDWWKSIKLAEKANKQVGKSSRKICPKITLLLPWLKILHVGIFVLQ